MDKIKLLQFAAPANKRMDRFIASVNYDIEKLNRLITDFNQANTDDKAEILIEIYHYQKLITDKYPANFNLLIPEYHQVLQVDLFNAIRQEFSSLGCNSVSKSSIDNFDLAVNANKQNVNTRFQFLINSIEKIDSPEQVKDLLYLKQRIRIMLAEENDLANRKELRDLIPIINAKIFEFKIVPEQQDKLIELLANMDADKLEKLTNILVTKKGLTKEELENFCSPEEIELFADYQISFLGGTRSVNFLVKSLTASFVLKIDNRWNAPKSVESQLSSYALKDTITPLLVDRVVAVAQPPIAGFAVNSSGLVITEFCTGGDLVAHRSFISPEEITKSAVHIYKQMAEILITFQENNAVFPDLKNMNWLLDSKGNLKLADTKAFLPAKNGVFNPNGDESFWYCLLHTHYLSPPEFASREAWDIDAAQAYMLGKNLYQYITDCGNAFLKEKGFFFHDPIFATVEGQELKELIEGLIREDPKERISLHDALARLTQLDCQLNPVAAANAQEVSIQEIKRLKQECLDLLSEVSQCTVGDQDYQMDNFVKLRTLFIETTNTEAGLKELKQELEYIKEASPLVNELNTVIANLREEGKRELFSVGKNAKANRIEAALCKVPVERRHLVLDADNGNAEVQGALASQRHLGEKLKSFLFKTSEAEDNSVTNFIKTKDKFKKLVNEASEQDSETKKFTK